MNSVEQKRGMEVVDIKTSPFWSMAAIHRIRGEATRAGGWVLLALLFLVGCSRQTELSGEVLVPMRSGAVQRAAGALVIVVPVTAAFEQDRRGLEESFQATVQTSRAGIRALKSVHDQALQEESNATLALAKANTLGPLNAALERSYAAMKKSGTALKNYQDALQDLHNAVARYQAEARQLMQKHALRTARTDVHGHFAIDDLDRQKVYLHAEAKTSDNQLAWLVPVELTEPSQKVDLSGSNAGWPFQLPKE